MKSKFKLHSIVILLSVISACVPARKYEDLQTKFAECEANKKTCEDDLKAKPASDSSARAELKLAELQLQKSRMDSIEIHSVHNKTKELYNALSDTYERLLKHNQNENDKYNGDLRDMEKKKLATEAQLDFKEASLNKMKDELNALQTDLKAREAKMLQLQTELVNRESKVKELQQLINDKDAAVKTLKDNLTQALLGYKDAGLEVYTKDGKVYVSLSDQLLFASGSIVVDKKGKEAIIKLASVLNLESEINILVEGHTDDVPMTAGAQIKDNWDLSVLRANSIVRILTVDGKLDPKRIIASGRGQYFPIDPAKTPEARKKNRRTEIILTPKLDQLMKILEKN